jgi:hypothetical protein
MNHVLLALPDHALDAVKEEVIPSIFIMSLPLNANQFLKMRF